MTEARKPIHPEQFEVFEAMILTGQIEHSEVQRLLDDNPEFASWYCERAARRRDR